MRTVAAAVLAALIGSAVQGADLKITGELKVPEYKIVRLKVEGADPNAAIAWDILNDEDKVDFEDVSAPDGVFRFTAPPGTYRVKAREVISKDGKTGLRTARAAVTIEPAANKPKPKPVPVPVPTPKPKPKPEPAPMPKPKPDPGPAPDATLAAAFRTALAADVTAGATREHATKLAAVYSAIGKLLGADTADVNAPKTLGELYQSAFEASVAAGVPRRVDNMGRLYLNNVRQVVAKDHGSYDTGTQLTAALRAEWAKKYERVGTALAAAAVTP